MYNSSVRREGEMVRGDVYLTQANAIGVEII